MMHVLVTGASGQIGPYLVRRLSLDRDVRLTLWGHHWTQPILGHARRAVDIADADAVAAAFDDAAPDAVVHAAAVTQVGDAWRDPQRAEAINVHATRQLAQLARKRNSRFIYLSTDLVFDGERGGYTELDPPRPLSVYGRTKLAGEDAALSAARGLVLRLPLMMGPTLSGRVKFFDHIVAALRERRRIELFDDEWRTPLGLDSAAAGIAAALRSTVTGRLHLAGRERLSRHEMGVRAARALGLDASTIIAASRLSISAPEPRAADTSLNCAKWDSLMADFARPGFDESLRATLAVAYEVNTLVN